MIDGQQADDKIVAVLEADLAYGSVNSIGDLPSALVDRLKHYFLSYKQFPGEAPRKVSIDDVYDREEALKVIRKSLEDYQNLFAAQ